MEVTDRNKDSPSVSDADRLIPVVPPSYQMKK